MSKSYTYNEVKVALKNRGYILLSDHYLNCKQKLLVLDDMGYKIFITFDKFANRKSNGLRFHSSNQYSIDNINHYIEINNIQSKCISDRYYNGKTPLIFLCECGEKFKTNWTTFQSFHKTKCDKCSGYNSRITFSEVKNNLLKYGYKLIIKEDEYFGLTSTNLICFNADGYKYKVRYDAIMRKKFPETFSKSNPFAIYNINVYLKKYTNGDYECVSNGFNGIKDMLNIRHNKCGRIFQNSWINIGRKRYLDKIGNNKTGALCPFCETSQLESTHALVLKQVWCHEYSDTEVEEKSCINPNTKCSLPTDIVNHRLKIAIEIQSWFHDFKDQQIKDEIKRTYWINKGYKFYAIDQRDYSVIEMIQLFFPQYLNIPSYIDFEYSNKINDIKIQQLLNSGLKVSEIAIQIGCNSHRIYDAIRYGRISYPKNYIPSIYTSVVQLNNDLKYVNEFDSIKEAKIATGYNNISSAISSKTHFSGGYYWVEKKAYYDGNYHIEKSRLSKFYIPVDQYDINDNFISHYNTIIKASKKYGCSNYSIYQVVIGKRKSMKGFIWKSQLNSIYKNP